jgi:hypothetical protein
MNVVGRRLRLLFAMLLVCNAAIASDMPSRTISVTDARPSEQLKGRRDSNFSAIAFLPDKAVAPLPIDQLRAALANHPGSALDVTVSELRVIDFFPSRAKKVLGGSPIMRALFRAKTDWSMTDKLGVPPTSDAVICIFSGTVNGRPFNSSAFSPYVLSPWVGLIRRTKNFKAAVASSIDQVAQHIVANAGQVEP